MTDHHKNGLWIDYEIPWVLHMVYQSCFVAILKKFEFGSHELSKRISSVAYKIALAAILLYLR